MKFNRSQRGIGLLELMLSLAIIAILLVMATRYFGSARQSQQIASAISLIQGITAGSQNYFLAKNNSMTGLTFSALTASNYLPAGTSKNNPWGGSITVTPDGTINTAVDITLTAVPTSACARLITVLTPQQALGAAGPPTCAGGSFSGVF